MTKRLTEDMDKRQAAREKRKAYTASPVKEEGVEDIKADTYMKFLENQ